MQYLDVVFYLYYMNKGVEKVGRGDEFPLTWLLDKKKKKKIALPTAEIVFSD